jgi:hypothetical protein
MKTTITTAVAVSALFLGVASCGGNGATATNTPPTVVVPQAGAYKQIERLATPALKEATENFNDHDITNRVNPYTEAANAGVLPTDATNFLTTTAGRSTAYATAIGKVVFPDVMIANLAQNATVASYFGVQTGGNGPTAGNTFGGRALTDDAIDVDLGVIFGNTLAHLGVTADDDKESPCLTTDNVPATAPNANTEGWATAAQVGAGKNETPNTFPYVGAPYTS